jgi:type II secretory pathway predicted ATPase ExeA
VSQSEPSSTTAAKAQVFETDSRRDALTRLTDGLGARESFLLITGDAGTGKTLLAREVISRWGERAAAAHVVNTAMSRAEFLEEILRRFGIEPPPAATKPQLLDRLQRQIAETEGRGKVPVIVIDDAQEIPDDLLGELRLLANAAALAHQPLEIMLVGLPALEHRLAQPALELVRQRIAVRVRAEAFSQQDTRRYLQEIVSVPPASSETFPRRASREIFRITQGVPRAVQTLGAESMKRARAAQSASVTIEHVWAASGRAPAAASERVAADAPSAASERLSADAPATVVPTARVLAASTPPSTAATTALSSAARAEAELPDEALARSAPAGTARQHDDPRVNEWIGKFIKPDEPRFGELLTSSIKSSAPGIPLAVPRDDATPEAQAVAPPRAHRGQRRGDRRQGDRRRDRGARAPKISGVLAASTAFTILIAAIAFILFAHHPHAAPAAAQASVKIARAHPAPVAAVVAPPVAVTEPVTQPVATAQPTAQPQWFSLEIATYTTPDQADAERDRVIAATGLKAWRVRGTGDSSEVYHVVLGSYSSEERARISAAELMRTSMVTEANVVPLPSRRLRK